MQDKIALLMEETGCDRGEAELALEMCGYSVEEAVKAIGRLLKNIVVLKGKFIHSEQNQFGLILVVLDTKSGTLLRSRAVLSYNPAVCAIALEKDWFEFEKYLYGCRLWEGSLPAESLEIERNLSEYFRSAEPASLARVAEEPPEALALELAAPLKGLLRAQTLDIRLKKDVLELGQFRSLRKDPADKRRRDAAKSARRWPYSEESLILKIVLVEDPSGVAAAELRAGDMVAARIVDTRDIAQYLAKLFGCRSVPGQAPVLAPIEAVEAGPSGILARVRFSGGVCGDATVPRENRLKVIRSAARERESSWWRRFFKG